MILSELAAAIVAGRCRAVVLITVKCWTYKSADVLETTHNSTTLGLS